MKTLYDLLTNVKQVEKKGIYMINGNKDEFMSYKELYQKAVHFFYIMDKRGIMKGDEVIIVTDSTEEFLVSFWGCILGGYIIVPITCSNSVEGYMRLENIRRQLHRPYLVTRKKVIQAFCEYMESKCQNQIEDMEQNCIDITESASMEGENFESASGDSLLPLSPNEEDIAFIQFSSGSTGVPKGVVLKHLNLMSNIKAIVKGLGKITESDASLSWLPLTHDMGLIGFHLSPMYCVANQVIMLPLYFMKRPLKWLEKANEYKCTIINSPNFGYEYFFKAYSKAEEVTYDLSHIRVIFNGAEPISYVLCNEFLDALEKNGLRKNAFFPVYGLAEASLAVTFPDVNGNLEHVVVDRNYLNVGDKIVVGEENMSNGVTFVKLGTAIEECNYRITNQEGKVCGQMTVGNIEIKGRNVTQGYYCNEEITSQIFTEDGWLRTGDVGATVEGQLVVIGRTKEIIIINGKNYFPDDMERIVANWVENEKYNIAAVSAFDHKRMTESLVVFIRNKGNLEDFCEISDKVKKVIGIQFGIEAVAVPISNLPKTTSGKVQRTKLRQRYEDREFTEVLSELNILYMEYKRKKSQFDSFSDTEKKIINIFESVFQGIDIGVYDNYVEYGISSLKLVNIVNLVQDEFKDCSIDISSIYTFQTIRQLSAYIDNQRDKKEMKEEIDKIYDVDEFLDAL